MLHDLSVFTYYIVILISDTDIIVSLHSSLDTRWITHGYFWQRMSKLEFYIFVEKFLLNVEKYKIPLFINSCYFMRNSFYI